ncbi:MAG TPA: AMP-binding protein [Streptosporangiaceae bacterium]|nr:AMP-binding protein [Streptosporangiaceae bacterium]
MVQLHHRPVYRPGLRRRLGNTVNVASALTRSGIINPIRPVRFFRQFAVLHAWGTTLAGEFTSAAARDPYRTALVDDRGELTYADVVERTSRLAAGFRLESPRPRIAVLCRNHRGLVETLIAGSKRGADMILLNTGYGAGQLRDVLTELRVDLMVADVEFADIVYKAPQAAQRVVVWADAPGGSGPELEDVIADSRPVKLRPPRVQGRMIMLSSGTTGRPKGARRRPRPGLRPLASMLSRIPLRVHDTMVIDAPIFHTWGFAAMQMGFAMRGTLVLHRRFAAEQTLRAIASHRKVDLFAAPVMVQRLMDLPPEILARYDTSALRIVAVSGSALPGDLASRFMDQFGDKLYNIYGSTEASWVSIATPRDLRADPGAAGRPPRGTKLAILDQHGRPVPPGIRGHIYAGNELIFEGYTSGAPSDMRDGLLGTGDLGHIDRSGLLHVDGRVDDLVVSGGENIFPREVEDALARLPEVLEVAVIGVPDPEYGQRLAAYIVPRPGSRLDADQVRGYIRERVARYAVPRDVNFISRLPRNATGKVVGRWLTESPAPTDGIGLDDRVPEGQVAF